MHFVSEIRRILERDREPLDVEEAARIWGATLDGAIDELEVGAIVGSLSAGETRDADCSTIA